MSTVRGRAAIHAGAAHPGFGTAAGHATVRRANLSLVLNCLRVRGARSRATIATDTGLNKATVSSLVADLIERGLVAESRHERFGGVGRPGQAVVLAGGRVAGVGVEMNADFVDVTALDLNYSVIAGRRVPGDLVTMPPRAALIVVADAVHGVLADIAAMDGQVVGVTVAFPGLIDRDGAAVAFSPNLPWRGVAVAGAVRELLGTRMPGAAALPVSVDNEANLGAIAEHALGVAMDTSDLVYLSGEVGVGGGFVVDGHLVRGIRGFSGEVGHMPLNPEPVVCGCGRVGCWETQVGLNALMRRVTGGRTGNRLDLGPDLDARLQRVGELAAAGDRQTLEALREVGTSLGVGVSLLFNLLNPGAVVLGGYFAVLGAWLLPHVEAVVRDRVVAPDAGGSDVRLSRLGFTAASRGGAVVALQRVFDDPSVVVALPVTTA